MFRKGQSGNPSGRPVGIKNNDLYTLKSILKNCFARNAKLIEQKIDRMIQESTDISDFKWLLGLKASLEPREIEVDAPQNQQIVLIRSNVTDVEAKPVETADTNGLDNRITDDSKIQA